MRDTYMQPLPHKLPALPEIGYPETYYARKVKKADLVGDTHTREAYKVGQYVTLALQPHLEWQEKLRYFRHAIRRHCCPPRRNRTTRREPAKQPADARNVTAPPARTHANLLKPLDGGARAC